MRGHEPPRPETVEELARQVCADLHQTIIFHESGALAGDVESVHDMRVSVRRLRVALNNFAVCVVKEDRKRLRSSLENLADALGGVRDMDVMIAALKASLTIRPAQEKVAVSALIGRLRARRRSRLRALMNYLGGEEYARFKRESPTDWIKDAQSGTDLSLSASNSHDGKAKVRPIVEPAVGTAVEIVEEEHGQAA
jgi:CHAD domain-containing protein